MNRSSRAQVYPDYPKCALALPLVALAAISKRRTSGRPWATIGIDGCSRVGRPR